MADRPITLAEAQRLYVHRYTAEHVPAWAARPAPNGRYYAPQYASDAEWYERTVFPGEDSLPLSHRGCISLRPTWPLGDSLDAPFAGRL